VGFNESDDLFEVSGAITGLPWDIGVIWELIVIGMVTKATSSCGIQVNSRIFLVH
jgi:hypothetical protein